MVRRGRRVGRSHLVVHVLWPDAAARADLGPGMHRRGKRSGEHRTSPEADLDTAPTREAGEPTRVGFVVSKAVGTAVVRHRVSRRLRHLLRDRIGLFPAGTLVVVRALPSAAAASSRELGADVDSALRKLRVLPSEGHGPPTGSA